MKKLPDRLMREILSAIIGSRMSNTDIRDLAELFRKDPSFVHLLSDSLLDLTWKLGSNGYEDKVIDLGNDNSDRSGLVGLLYEIVQRKRMSKRVLSKLMRDSEPGYSGVSSELSVREMLGNFLNSSSSTGVYSFMGFLGLDFSQDAYLREIDNGRVGKK